jgi:threonine/homoserine/homoserine lactone efflux protein
LTSVTIGIVGIVGVYRLIPIPIGIVGILFLFYGSILMLRETRMATATVNAEMDFTWELARTVAPENIINKYGRNAFRKGKLATKIHETLSNRRTEKES